MTSASYILTLYDNQIQQNWSKLHDDMFESGKILYLGSQLEKCPNTGRLHWQAFCKFHREAKQRGTWFKRFHNGIHFTKCSKERAEAIGYGTKGETRVEGPKESGIKPEPVKKFNGEDCKQLILAGKEQEIPFDYVLRFNLERRIGALREYLQSDQRLPLPTFLPNPWGFILPSKKISKKRHYWIYSRVPNKGKTYHFALPLREKYLCSIQTGDFTYFNVMDRTGCVLLDEYNSSKLKWDSLNAMCDGTYSWRRFNQPSIVLDNPLIIVLSNQSISDLYPFMNTLLYERFNEKELV